MIPPEHFDSFSLRLGMLSFAAVIIVVLERFVEDQLIVSGLVDLDDALKAGEGRHREKGTLEIVRRAVWGMLYTYDAGMVLTSPRSLIRMMDVIVVACLELGLAASEKKIEAMHLWSNSSTTSNALQIETPGQRYKQTNELVSLGGAISESAGLDIENKPRISAAWAIRRYSSHFYDRWNARLSLTIRLFDARRGRKLCCTDVPRELCALKTLEVCVPPTTSYVFASSAFGARNAPGTNSYRMERLWRGPIPNALKQYFEAQTRVRQGPYKARQLKALEESDVGAAGGARAHAMSLTGDVLGGLPTKRSQGLQGNPAHRYRSEVGRIRGCCHKWTVLDGCCKERGCDTGGSRREQKHSITPDDARTFTISTCGTSARPVD